MDDRVWLDRHITPGWQSSLICVDPAEAAHFRARADGTPIHPAADAPSPPSADEPEGEIPGEALSPLDEAGSADALDEEDATRAIAEEIDALDRLFEPLPAAPEDATPEEMEAVWRGLPTPEPLPAAPEDATPEEVEAFWRALSTPEPLPRAPRPSMSPSMCPSIEKLERRIPLKRTLPTGLTGPSMCPSMEKLERRIPLRRRGPRARASADAFSFPD
jgi:hypothetical protein